MKLNESTFTIVSNGYADGPSQALRDFLLKKSAKRVTSIAHPLVIGGDNKHIFTNYEFGKTNTSELKLPHLPPYTFLFDMFVPFKIPKDSVWFGFNNLACLRGLVRRRFNRSEKVIYWAVDFVPQRFGTGLATRVYNAVDRFVCTHADVRVELSQAGLDGRNSYLSLSRDVAAPSLVIPMGAWLDRTPKTTTESWKSKRIVYMGHIVERQGVIHAVNAVASLVKKYPGIHLDIVGGGPGLNDLRTLVLDLGVNSNITFHGFVADHKDVELLLSKASIAVAPYVKSSDNFTQNADPGKIKAYLGASLPIVMTGVPPIAKDISDRGAGILVDDTTESVAEGISKLLDDELYWQRTRAKAEAMAKEFDWEILLSDGLKTLGINT